MTKVKLYGTATSTYQYIKKCVVEYFNFHDLEFQLEEINDVKRFIADNITSVPYILLNDHHSIELSNVDYFQNDLKSFFDCVSTIVDKSKLRKILVPVDFSNFTTSSIFFTKIFCKHKFFHVDILHIHHPKKDGVSNTTEIQQKVTTIINEIDSDFIGDFSNKIVVNSIVKQGFAADEIISLSSQYEYIIMGTHGATNLLERMVGSVSEKVATHASCPVILIPEHISFYKFNTIAILYDSDQSQYNLQRKFENISIVNIHLNDEESLNDSLKHEDTIYCISRKMFSNLYSILPDKVLLKVYHRLLMKGRAVLVN